MLHDQGHCSTGNGLGARRQELQDLEQRRYDLWQIQQEGEVEPSSFGAPAQEGAATAGAQLREMMFPPSP